MRRGKQDTAYNEHVLRCTNKLTALGFCECTDACIVRGRSRHAGMIVALQTNSKKEQEGDESKRQIRRCVCFHVQLALTSPAGGSRNTVAAIVLSN
jgi:hypothetical protein